MALFGHRKKDANPENEALTPVSVCMSILPDGKKYGFVSSDSDFPNIPEIMAEARPVVLRLLTEVKKEDPKTAYIIAPIWSAYAAIGAVYKWKEDFEELKTKGIYDAVTAARGVGELDEWVSDEVLGWGFNSNKSNTFVAHLKIMVAKTLGQIKKSGNTNADQILALLMGFYYYGMIVGMNALGMK